MHAVLRDRLISNNRAGTLKAAYHAGYTDAVVLLRPHRDSCVSEETIERVQARHLHYVATMKSPTEEGRAYIAGFGDAAADNLPYPSHAFAEHRIAA